MVSVNYVFCVELITILILISPEKSFTMMAKKKKKKKLLIYLSAVMSAALSNRFRRAPSMNINI